MKFLKLSEKISDFQSCFTVLTIFFLEIKWFLVLIFYTLFILSIFVVPYAIVYSPTLFTVQRQGRQLTSLTSLAVRHWVYSWLTLCLSVSFFCQPLSFCFLTCHLLIHIISSLFSSVPPDSPFAYPSHGSSRYRRVKEPQLDHHLDRHPAEASRPSDPRRQHSRGFIRKISDSFVSSFSGKVPVPDVLAVLVGRLSHLFSHVSIWGCVRPSVCLSARPSVCP